MSIDAERHHEDPPEKLREALIAAKDFGNDLRIRIANIRSLHRKSTHNSLICEICFEPYPCDTVRAANGENL